MQRHLAVKQIEPCNDGNADCVSWDPEYIWIHPGLLSTLLSTLLVISALPAFGVGDLLVRTLGRLGVSHLTTFMVAMPLLIVAWYFFVGWLFDRWIHRRRERLWSTQQG